MSIQRIFICSPVGTTDVVLGNAHVGLIAGDGSPKARGVDMLAALMGQLQPKDESPFEMGCDYFHIRSRGRKLP